MAVEFETPSRDWIYSLTRPVIDFFLFDLKENTDLRQTSFQNSRGNGKAMRRMSPRRMDLYYMVTAFSTVVEDEHLLLWRTLVTLMKHAQFPPETLSESLRAADPPIATRVAQPDDGPSLVDLWSALEAAPHPALVYVVTAPLDLEIALESPLVLTRTARYTGRAGEPALELGTHIGGVVRDRQGRPLAGARVNVEGSAAQGSVTNSEGEFVLYSLPSGAATLQVSPPTGPRRRVTVEIPSERYEIVLDE